jgi:5-methylcytosine-specific restriction endonuclease McrA
MERNAFLELGFRGAFDYCVQYLNYSEAAATLRRHVAGVCVRFPVVLERLARNEIGLTVAAKLAPHLTEENVEELLRECAGMSKREVEAVVTRFDPKPVVSSGIRRRPVRPARVGGAIPEGPPAIRAVASSPPPVRPPRSIEPARPEVYNVRFSMSQAMKEKLERMAEVLGIHNPEKNLATILEKLLEIGLEEKDPQRKLARRRRREARKAESMDSPHRPADGSGFRSRHIPAVIRERVLERAGYRCEHSSGIGVRCSQRTGLNIDHVQPYALEGEHDEKNLRALCSAHNSWHAKRVFGAAFIEAKIRETRERRLA